MSTATAWRIVEAGRRITAIRPIDAVCWQARRQDADDQLQRSPDQALWMHAKRLVNGADIRLLAKDALHGPMASHLVHVYSTGEGETAQILCVAAERIDGRWRLVQDSRFSRMLGQRLVEILAADEAVRLISDAGCRFTTTYVDRLADTIAAEVWEQHLRPDQAAARVWEWEERRVYA